MYVEISNAREVFGRTLKIQRGGWVFTSRSVYVFKKRTTFIYIFFVIIIFVYFSNCQTRIVGPVLIREFIASLTVDYSPIDHARLTCLKVKIVILFLG